MASTVSTTIDAQRTVSSYHYKPSPSSSSFVITPYHPAQDGRMAPEMPTYCPYAGSSGQDCRVVKNHFRERKTGPCYPIAVVRCRVHRQSFTLYPPGHFPYGRQALLPMAPDGSIANHSNEQKSCSDELFEDTYFNAALDAAQATAWERLSDYEHATDKWWSTQVRRIRVSSRLLGVEPNIEPRKRFEYAVALGIDQLFLLDASRKIVNSSGYRSQGEAVKSVLTALAAVGFGPRLLLQRLVFGGFLAGLWGMPFFWDPSAQLLRSPAFLSSRSPTSSSPIDPVILSTKLKPP